MKKALIGLLLIAMLAAACVTVIPPAPAAPAPVNNPPATALPQAVTPNPPQATPASFNMPEVAAFTVQPANILSGNFATLTWDIRNSYDVSIEPRFGITRPSGSQPVNPPFTTTYKLTANNSQGSILATTTLTVSGAMPTVDTPVVNFFTANPYVIRKGESAILSWKTTGGSSVSIDKSPCTLSGGGTIQVTPVNTTTYMLSVTSPDGAQCQSATLNGK